MAGYNEKLISVEAFKDGIDGFGDLWYLKLVFGCEDEKGKYEVIFPKVSLPISQYHIPLIEDRYGDTTYISCDDEMRLFDGTSTLAESKGVNTSACVFKILTEPKVHEMTLDEIEKKLGYKIKIVNKE